MPVIIVKLILILFKPCIAHPAHETRLMGRKPRMVGIEDTLSSGPLLREELVHPLVVEVDAAHAVGGFIPEGPHPRHHGLVVWGFLQFPDLDHEL